MNTIIITGKLESVESKEFPTGIKYFGRLHHVEGERQLFIDVAAWNMSRLKMCLGKEVVIVGGLTVFVGRDKKPRYQIAVQDVKVLEAEVDKQKPDSAPEPPPATPAEAKPEDEPPF